MYQSQPVAVYNVKSLEKRRSDAVGEESHVCAARFGSVSGGGFPATKTGQLLTIRPMSGQTGTHGDQTRRSKQADGHPVREAPEGPFRQNVPDRCGFWGSNREVPAGLWFPSWSLETRVESSLPRIRDGQKHACRLFSLARGM